MIRLPSRARDARAGTQPRLTKSATALTASLPRLHRETRREDSCSYRTAAGGGDGGGSGGNPSGVSRACPSSGAVAVLSASGLAAAASRKKALPPASPIALQSSKERLATRWCSA